MSTWVISLLVILVAIPLIFMGLGDYQSPSKTYAMKINGQLITNSQLDQEIYQYKQALQENFGGQIPPIYTDKFIRQLTINYMMRSILMDQMSKKIGLAYHNDSILENIYNTSAFRDEKGFNNNLYKSQLFRLNTTPEAYERYIYQKGIKDQLQNSITETSLFTKLEKTNLSKYRFQQRDISYKIIEKSSFDKNINITEKELIEYYESNKNMFIEPLSAQFSYIDVSRDEIISNITITDEEIMRFYKDGLVNGDYKISNKYEINHIYLDDNDESKRLIGEIQSNLKSGKSFESISENYPVSQESKSNNGYMGTFIREDLPSYISQELSKLKIGEISEPIYSNNTVHFIAIKNIIKGKEIPLNEVQSQIRETLKREKGMRKYFDILDEVNNSIYSGENDIEYFSQLTGLSIKVSAYITVDSGADVFKFQHVRDEVLNKSVINDGNISEPIFVDDNRFLVAKTKNITDKSQISFEESKPVIKKILIQELSQKKMAEYTENYRNDLNAGIEDPDESFKDFIGTFDSTNINQEYLDVFFNSNPSLGYQFKRLNNNSMILFIIKSINLPSSISSNDNYLDFMTFSRNTLSESDFSEFYRNFMNNSEIELDEDYRIEN